MSQIDDILNGLPLDEIANQVDANPEEVHQAAAAVLPALLGGLHANAQDVSGAASIAQAATQHQQNAPGSVALSDIDTADGQKAAAHIFGDNQSAVVNQLGGLPGVDGALVKKLIPILAPIVLGYLSKQLSQKSSGGGSGGGDIVSTILEEVLKGASQGSAAPAGKSAGSIIGDVLGGLLGGGRR